MKYAFFARAIIVCGSLVSGCETSNPTQAVFANEYPASDASSASGVTIYKAWWSIAQLPEPVSAGADSDPVRIVEGSDFAYALLAPEWDPTTQTPPVTLVPVRTERKLSAARGDTLRIIISDTTTVGNCASGRRMSQEEADLITQRIFPAEFAGRTYDASNCTAAVIADSGPIGGGGESGLASEAGRVQIAGAGGEAGAP